MEHPIKMDDYTWELVNQYLVGGAISPSWKIMDFVHGKDDIPYMKWTIPKNVWNHQPAIGFNMF